MSNTNNGEAKPLVFGVKPQMQAVCIFFYLFRIYFIKSEKKTFERVN